MSKPRLQLVHSSDDAQPEALIWQRGRGLRPLVLRKGARERSSQESVWQAGLELVHLGLLASCANYAAFMQTAIAVLDLCSNPEDALTWEFETAGRARER